MRITPLGIAIALVVEATLAFADADKNIVWQAPPPCPQEADVRGIVGKWLGRRPDRLELGSIRAVANVTRHPSGWLLDLAFESPGGSEQESLVAARCEALAKVVALKVALAADPLATFASIEEPREPPKSAPVPARVPSTPRGPSRLGWGARLAGGLAFGLLPDVAPGVSLVASARFLRLRLELGGAYWFAREARYEELPAIGGRFTLLSGMARGCAKASLGSLEAPLCAGVEAGLLRGSGFGVPDARTESRPWVALTFGPALAVPVVKSLYVWVEVDAVLGLLRPGYRVANLGRLYRPGSGSVQGWAGLELRFE